MTAPEPAFPPAAHAGPRRRILEALRSRGPQTAEELARLLGGGTVGMRAHLRTLAAAGLVEASDERRPIGRPARRYALTAAADALFPKHYELFSIHLAEALITEIGEDALERILQRWQDDLAAWLDGALPEGFEARLRALVAHQSRYGFMAEQDGDAIVERNCPIARVAARFPRICEHEAAVFSRTLRASVEVASCQARGDAICRFRVRRSG